MKDRKAKRIAASRWVPLLLLACLAGGSLAAPVFRVIHPDGTHSYLVGTMHSEDPRVTALADRLRPLIAEVDQVALELVPDGLTMVAVGLATLLPADQSLLDIVGDGRAPALLRAAERRQIPPAVLDRLKPWAAAVTLGMPAAETGRFLDMEIYLAALAAGRSVTGLETAAEQLSLFERMSLQRQLELLDVMVKDAGDLPQLMEDLTVVYLSGDLAALEREGRQQFAGLPEATAAWLDHALIERRNGLMVERSLALLAQGTAMIAVGALHLPGESGLVAGLEGAGYRLERVADWPKALETAD